jgi:hypothetical protein
LPTHSPRLSDEEALKLAMEAFEVEEMSKWEGFSFQLRESAIAQGLAVTLLRTS